MSNSIDRWIVTRSRNAGPRGDNLDTRPTRRALRICLLILAGASLAGCFDAEAMIAAKREIANRTRLEEVDLGEFHVSLPRTTDHIVAPEIHFHAFCQVANRDLKTVNRVLEESAPEIRHRLLLVTRQLTAQELEDPRLTSLRTNMVNVLNEQFPGEPVKSVGFYRLTLANL